MHLADGLLSARVNGALAVVSVATCGVASWRARSNLGESQAALTGLVAAFLFAAQMLNFPIIGAPVSGHFLGATMAALLLGPLNACLVMSLVLVAQCFLFADGGMTALGSNIFNMGIIGAIGGGLAARTFRLFLPRSRGAFVGSAVLASWLSVMAGAAACSFELALSGTLELRVALFPMLGYHAVIGIGEALITAGVLGIVLGARPDLVSAWPQPAAVAP